MLSRRNIRVKVMHLMYAKKLDKAISYDDLTKRFDRMVEQSYNLLLFNLEQMIRTAFLSNADADRRAVKHIPSEADKAFTPRLYDNDLIQSLVSNPSFQKNLKERSISSRIDAEMSKLLYSNLAKTEAYQTYVLEQNPNHEEMLLTLYKDWSSSESYEEYMEEKFDNWIHDKSLIIGAVKKIVKGLPAEQYFFRDYYPQGETVEFGKDLLYKVNHFEEDLMGIIEPALKNWDSNRVATIDLILLKLALSEMLYFPSIPLKVTINEFVDVSKIYSTPKSKDFINGVLDRLMKKLTADGRIIKEGRGLID